MIYNLTLTGNISLGGIHLSGNIDYTVPSAPAQEKSVTPTKQEQIVLPDVGHVLSKVEVAAIPDQYIDPTGTKQVTQNGTVNVREYQNAEVAVPNTYTAGDEGKVVQSGALVEQTDRTVTENGVYDTTTNKQVTVDVLQLTTYATSLAQMFWTANNMDGHIPTNIPQIIKVDAPNCEAVTQMFKQYLANARYSLGIKEVWLSPSRQYGVDVGDFLNRNDSIEKVVFPNGIYIARGVYGFIRDAMSLKSVIGEISIAPGITYDTTNPFTAPLLEDITFARNTLYFPTVKFTSPNLTDASLVSIANGLDGTVTGATLQHHATAKTRCEQIVGTVTDGVFTISESGTVTLADFITSTKGWTLA